MSIFFLAPLAGSTKKPEDMYRIIEHFAVGRRRLELFGENHNIRSGWLTAGKGLSSSNFNAEVHAPCNVRMRFKDSYIGTI